MRLVSGLFRRVEAQWSGLKHDPDAAAERLDALILEIGREIESADGAICYRLEGPEPAKTTPMEYGGFFLEREREILRRAKDRGETWLWVDAGEGAYLDFVSDLEADVFAWDAKATGFPLAEMSKLRTGRLCTNEAGSDVEFDPEKWIREAELASCSK